MKRSTMLVAGGTLALTAIAGGGSIAVANGTGDSDAPIDIPALDEAVVAALASTGGGTVIETEVGDDGAAYGVEVRLDDGSQVEVNLDASFRVMDREPDDDGPSEQPRDGEVSR